MSLRPVSKTLTQKCKGWWCNSVVTVDGDVRRNIRRYMVRGNTSLRLPRFETKNYQYYYEENKLLSNYFSYWPLGFFYKKTKTLWMLRQKSYSMTECVCSLWSLCMCYFLFWIHCPAISPIILLPQHSFPINISLNHLEKYKYNITNNNFYHLFIWNFSVFSVCYRSLLLFTKNMHYSDI
jgi:hypothetical protein